MQADIADLLHREDWVSPTLAPEEHAWVEDLVGRTLTSEEAQGLLHEAKLLASWGSIEAKRGLR
jgi:hypothetical protein